MTTLDTLLARPEVAALGWTLVHFLWQGGVIAVALAVALITLRKGSPHVRYATCAGGMRRPRQMDCSRLVPSTSSMAT